MDKDKEKQEISLIGRLFSLEALLIVMGVLSLVSGIATGSSGRLLLGIGILAAFVIFFLITKRGSGK